MGTRYLLIHKEMGVFLGTYLKYVLFAKNDSVDVVKVYSFKNEESAHFFAVKSAEMSEEDYFVAPIKSDEKYIHVIDVIKAGYKDHVYGMIDNMQMISYQTH